METLNDGDGTKSGQTGSLQAIITKLSMGRIDSRKKSEKVSSEQMVDSTEENRIRLKESQSTAAKKRVMESLSTPAIDFSDEQEIQLDTEKPLLSVGKIKIEPIDPIETEETSKIIGQCRSSVAGTQYFNSLSKNDKTNDIVRGGESSPSINGGRKVLLDARKDESSPKSQTISSIINNGAMLFTCNVCGLACTTKGSLEDHKQEVHDKNEIFACQFCNKVFTHQSARKVHMRIHFDVRPFQCPMCDKRFRGSSHLKDHIRTHTGERPFVCEICGKGFKQASDLRKHRPTHLNKKKFNCRICGCEFSRLSLFIDHMQTVHPAVPPMKEGPKKTGNSTPHICACGKTFSTVKKLTEHFQVSHTGQSSGTLVGWNSPTEKPLTPSMGPVQSLLRSEPGSIHPALVRGPLSPATVVIPAVPLPVLSSQMSKGMQAGNQSPVAIHPMNTHISPKKVLLDPVSSPRIGVTMVDRHRQPGTNHVVESAKLVPVVMNGPIASFRGQGPIITAVSGNMSKTARCEPVSGRQSVESDITITSVSSCAKPVHPHELTASSAPGQSLQDSTAFTNRPTEAKGDDHGNRRVKDIPVKQVFRFPSSTPTAHSTNTLKQTLKPIIHQVILIQGASYKVLPLPLPASSTNPSVVVINQANKESPTLQVINMDNSQETNLRTLASPRGAGAIIQSNAQADIYVPSNSPFANTTSMRSLLHLPVKSLDEVTTFDQDESNLNEGNNETTSCESEIEGLASPGQQLLGSRKSARNHFKTDLDNAFVCGKCNCRFVTLAQLQHHKVLFHQAKGVFACSRCPRSFPSRQKLTNHKIIHLSSLRAKLKCYLCGKRFRTEKMLVQHVMHKHKDTLPVQYSRKKSSLNEQYAVTSRPIKTVKENDRLVTSNDADSKQHRVEEGDESCEERNQVYLKAPVEI